MFNQFFNTLNNLFWIRYVVEPTRYRLGKFPYILDLTFTNNVAMIKNMPYPLGFG